MATKKGPTVLNCAIVREKVNSSNIRSIGYNDDFNTLEVEFWSSGAIWRYWPIEHSEYNSLMKADSVGSHFAKEIKNKKDLRSQQVNT